MLKELIWRGSTRRDIRAFPKDARKRAGYELYRVQQGAEPSDWKPMPSVGTSVCEIRVHSDREHRVIYVATFVEGVYILHAFEKKSRKTARADLAVARKRFRDVIQERKRAKR